MAAKIKKFSMAKLMRKTVEELDSMKQEWKEKVNYVDSLMNSEHPDISEEDLMDMSYVYHTNYAMVTDAYIVKKRRGIKDVGSNFYTFGHVVGPCELKDITKGIKGISL